MKILIIVLLLVLFVAGCVGQMQGTSGQPSTGGATTSGLDSDLQGITDDINAMSADSSDLSAPSVDLSLP